MSEPKFGLLAYPGIENLGDVIQSLAAERFLPRVDALIPRERISEPPPASERVKAILNGWFMHNPSHWPPHAQIEPLLISMHFVEPGVSHLRRWAKSPIERMTSGEGAEFLKRWGPVGARDLWTLEQLQQRGIDAYLSGCLTLTLQRAATARGEAIVACDLSPAALARLQANTDREVISVTHLGGERLSQEQQQQAADDLLSLYASAAAVVTTRIHAAQPCLALETPVLLVHSKKPGRRVTDVAPLMHSCTESAFLKSQYDFDFKNPPPNPENFRPLVNALVQRCKKFTGFDRFESMAPKAG